MIDKAVVRGKFLHKRAKRSADKMTVAIVCDLFEGVVVRAQPCVAMTGTGWRYGHRRDRW